MQLLLIRRCQTHKNLYTRRNLHILKYLQPLTLTLTLTLTLALALTLTLALTVPF